MRRNRGSAAFANQHHSLRLRRRQPFVKSEVPYRTAKLSSYDAYRISDNDDPDERLCVHEERGLLLLRFPFAVMLEVAYPEVDIANRWCWKTFGPKFSPCYQFQSSYPCCLDESMHEHQGVWCTYWFAKSDYDFGFNEWYFRDRQHHDMFLCFVPLIHWGERFPG